MGENKGHGIKGPRHDDDVDDLTIDTASGEIAPGGQQQSSNMHPGQQQDSMQSDALQGNQQSVQDDGPQAGSQQAEQQSGQQQSRQQQQGNQQSGQQGDGQHGGQHASGGTPALDDLEGGRGSESAQDASQAFDQGSSAGQQNGNR